MSESEIRLAEKRATEQIAVDLCAMMFPVHEGPREKPAPRWRVALRSARHDRRLRYAGPRSTALAVAASMGVVAGGGDVTAGEYCYVRLGRWGWHRGTAFGGQVNHWHVGPVCMRWGWHGAYLACPVCEGWGRVVPRWTG